jgi:hypothetical protein
VTVESSPSTLGKGEWAGNLRHESSCVCVLCTVQGAPNELPDENSDELVACISISSFVVISHYEDVTTESRLAQDSNAADPRL